MSSASASGSSAGLVGTLVFAPIPNSTSAGSWRGRGFVRSVDHE